MSQPNNSFIDKQLGDYLLEEEVGHGLTGQVFRASNPSQPDKHFAVKIFNPGFGSSGDQREELYKRFLREQEILSSLHHPNIVSIIEAGEQDGFSYFVMPYLGGGTLAKAIREQHFTPEQAASIINALASALDYAHERNVIHRDIKPANILLDEDGIPYLVDFSIARAFDLHQSTSLTKGGFLGTFVYAAPEQIKNKIVSPRTDIYGLGIVLYEMITGQMPFASDDLSEVIRRKDALPPSPRQYLSTLPEPAAAAVQKAMAVDPENRFASAGELAHAFSEGLQGRWVAGVSLQRIEMLKSNSTNQVLQSKSMEQMPSEKTASKRYQWLWPVLVLALLSSLIFGIIHLGPMLRINSNSQSQISSMTTTAAYSYSATIPDRPCDKGGAAWATSSTLTAICLEKSLQITLNSGEKFGEVLFYGNDHLPQNYRVGVTITALKNGGCAGIITNSNNSHNGGYAFLICDDGNWVISRFDANNSPTNLYQGKIDSQNSYTLSVDSRNGNHSISINSVAVYSFSDTKYPGTDYVSLFINPINQSANVVWFNDFSFEELAA